MQVGIKEQLAALLVAGNKPELGINGSPGEWFVTVRNYDDSGRSTTTWLASARQPSNARIFKTLDAAHSAAVEVAKMADPARESQYVRVAVGMHIGELA